MVDFHIGKPAGSAWNVVVYSRSASALCEFRLSLDIGPGQTLWFSPDKAVYKRTCKRANDPDFDYECPELWVAIELFLEAPGTQRRTTAVVL
jgi:hypothetical protein